MKEKFKKIWNDSVWSSVISAIIIGVLTVLWLAILSIFGNRTFSEYFSTILNIQIKLKYILIALLVLMLILIIFKLFNKKKIKYNDDHQNLDLKLFTEIRDKYLPSNRSIDFLRKSNFSGSSFSRNNINDLEDISYKFDDPYMEFIDSDLNEEFEKMKLVINQFLEELGENTWTVGHPKDGILSVPKEWQHEQYDRYKKVTDSLHYKADTICTTYDKIIRLGKMKFGV